MEKFQKIMEKIGIVSAVFVITIFNYVFFRIVFDYIIEEKYEDLVFILIFVGIIIILFGYWLKRYICNYYSGPYTTETIQQWRKKQKLKEKLTLNQKITLNVIDGYGVKLFNKIGFIIIFIGILILVISSGIK